MKDKQISDNTAARKRTAPLDQDEEADEEAGECLTPAAMAAFLGNSCSPEAKDQALRHIGLCRSCYGKWLILVELRLDRGQKHQTKEGRSNFLRPSNLITMAIAMVAMICFGLLINSIPFTLRKDREPATAAGTKLEQAMRARDLLPFRQWQQEMAAICHERDRQEIDRDRLQSLFQAGKRALPAWRQQPPPPAAEPSPQSLLFPLLDQAQSEDQLLGHCQEILTASATTPD